MNTENIRENIRIFDAFVKSNYSKMLRPAKGAVKYPFIDPGAGYENNLWDWDSFWSAYGLFYVCEHFKDTDDFDYKTEKQKVIDHAKGSVLNFFDLQMDDGYILMSTYEKEFEKPYLNELHKSGHISNMHKPFLAQAVRNVCLNSEDWGWMRCRLDNLKKYFACYDRYYYNENSGLYVFADDIMIGMDNDPAVFGRPGFSTASIYLNSFLHMEFMAMADICLNLGDAESRTFFIEKADKLQKAIQQECWDVRDGFFYSADVDVCTRHFAHFHQGLGVFWKTLPIKIRTWCGFLPMLAQIATKEQAEEIVRRHYYDENFYCDYGIRTLSKDEKMYNTTETTNPSNWLGPVWIISNYCVFKSLLNYGFLREANEMAEKTLRLLCMDIEKSGNTSESYVPENGEPMMYSGFLNWNILPVAMLCELNDYEQLKG